MGRTRRDKLPGLDGFAGLRNDVSAERFEPADLEIADNVDLDDAGQAARREGFTRKVAGAAHSLFAHGDACLFAQGTSLYLLNADYSTRVLATGLSGAPIAYAAIAGRIYYTDGTVKGVFEDGAVRSWGLRVPGVPGVTDIPGSFAPGTYGVAFTYQRRDGQQSGASALATITLAEAAGLHVSLPVPTDPTVTHVVMWMTPANGEVLYHFHDFAAGAVGADISGPDWPRAQACHTRFLTPPLPGQALGAHKGRLWVAAGDRLYPSEAFSYELYDERAHVPIDGTRVTLLAPVTGGMYVGTQQGTFLLRGADPKDMMLEELSPAGVIEGSIAWQNGALIGDGSLAGATLPVWTSTEGAVIAGTRDGQLVELSRPRYSATPGVRAAALARVANGMNQYLVTLQD